jgi:hypothetical protein
VHRFTNRILETGPFCDLGALTANVNFTFSTMASVLLYIRTDLNKGGGTLKTSS